MSEYTPSTGSVLNFYVYAGRGVDGQLRASERELRAEFDRWAVGFKNQARLDLLARMSESLAGESPEVALAVGPWLRKQIDAFEASL